MVYFINNPAELENFTSITVDAKKILKSWRLSILAHEWLTREGTLKPLKHLKDKQKQDVEKILETLENQRPIEKPILGIGILDNVEIGAGQATFAALLTNKINAIEVHIPVSNKDEFEKFTI